MLGKYFYPNNDLPDGPDEGLLSFDLTECEQCDCKVLAANSINVVESEAKLIQLGATRKKPPRHELIFCESLGKAVCESCYAPMVQEDESIAVEALGISIGTCLCCQQDHRTLFVCPGCKQRTCNDCLDGIHMCEPE